MVAHHPTVPGVAFKDIAGFPGYCVGDDGSVWTWKVRGPKFDLPDEWVKLSPVVGPKGYLKVGLSRNGQSRQRQVHHLVLEAFVGPCPPGMEACHDPDPDPANCRLDNLRWDTRKNNHADKKKHGTQPIGEKNHNSKLSDTEARKLVGLRRAGATYPALAQLFGVSLATAQHTGSGRTRKHLQDVPDPLTEDEYKAIVASLPPSMERHHGMRCRHSNVSYIEEAYQQIEWGFRSRRIVDDSVSSGHLTGAVRVKCHDCGFEHRYEANSRRPKWVEKLGKRISDRST